MQANSGSASRRIKNSKRHVIWQCWFRQKEKKKEILQAKLQQILGQLVCLRQADKTGLVGLG